MNKIDAEGLCRVVRNLVNFYDGKSPAKPRDAVIASFRANLVQAARLTASHGLGDANRIVMRALKVSTKDVSLSRLTGEAMHVHDAILDDLSELQCVYVKPDLAKYFDQERLFGDDVWEIREARYDIREAGNCIAIESGTAAVFHLMRVAEHGLRKIAKRVDVKLSDKGKPQPIEFGDWNEVINGVKKQIAAARQLSRGPDKEKRLNFYSDASDQCEYMKDIWRNTISHARGKYNTQEALGVFQRVEHFMQRLASEMPKIKVAKV